MSLRPTARLTVAALLVAGASACAGGVQAPTDAGVCWHMVQEKGGKVVFNKVAENQPNLENCAARLEALRVRFVQMGGSHTEISGAYQGNFIFVQREGVYTSPKLNGGSYLALVRTGDGRLAVPGAMPSS